MTDQYTLDGKPIKRVTCTIKTDDGATISIRASNGAAKALVDGFVQAMRKDQERRWTDD